MGLIEDIGPGPVCLDTAVVIYFIEQHPRYLPVVLPVFEAIDQERIGGVVTALTLLEVLVVPYRVGDLELARAYERLLTGSRGLTMLALDIAVFRSAARIRALTNAKTPDSLQLSGAAAAGCSVLLTNDRDLPATRGLRVVQLEEYVPK